MHGQKCCAIYGTHDQNFALFIERMISHEQIKDKGVKVGMCSKKRLAATADHAQVLMKTKEEKKEIKEYVLI